MISSSCCEEGRYSLYSPRLQYYRKLSRVVEGFSGLGVAVMEKDIVNFPKEADRVAQLVFQAKNGTLTLNPYDYSGPQKLDQGWC
jgi:hypothetical protein